LGTIWSGASYQIIQGILSKWEIIGASLYWGMAQMQVVFACLLKDSLISQWNR
jgi:hypothetical protein